MKRLRLTQKICSTDSSTRRAVHDDGGATVFFDGDCDAANNSLVIAKFHYTDTDTDTDFFVAKLRWVRAGPFRRKKVRVRVRVRVVEFSS